MTACRPSRRSAARTARLGCDPSRSTARCRATSHTLVAADALARELGLDALWIKDESQPLRPAGVQVPRRVAGRSRNCSAAASDLDELRGAAREQGIDRLTTATDGNHGRAVARMAALVGPRATIYMPDGDAARRGATRSSARGRRARRGRGGLRRGGAAVARRRRGRPGAAAPSTTPTSTARARSATWVIDGYWTLFARDRRAAAAPDASIDMVLLQTGVGAFASRGVRWAASHGVAAIAVDPPARRASPRRSRRAAGHGRDDRHGDGGPRCRHALGGRLADPGRRPRRGDRGRDDEADARRATLAALGIEAGESGAAGLAGLHALVEDPRARSCARARLRRGARGRHRGRDRSRALRPGCSRVR